MVSNPSSNQPNSPENSSQESLEAQQSSEKQAIKKAEEDAAAVGEGAKAEIEQAGAAIAKFEDDGTPAVDTGIAREGTHLLGAIPFENIIGAPLAAAVKAQGLAARETVEFIQAVGFDGEKGKTRTIQFQYEKSGDDGKPKTSTLTVPLLTIVPIPYLSITEMNIGFTADINAKSEASKESLKTVNANAQNTTDIKYWVVNSKFTAGVSSKRESKAAQNSSYSVEYNMDVSVHATNEDMPKGLQTVLKILADSVTSQDNGSSE